MYRVGVHWCSYFKRIGYPSRNRVKIHLGLIQSSVQRKEETKGSLIHIFGQNIWLPESDVTSTSGLTISLTVMSYAWIQLI